MAKTSIPALCASTMVPDTVVDAVRACAMAHGKSRREAFITSVFVGKLLRKILV